MKSSFQKQSEVFKDNDHVNQREAKEKSRVASDLGNHAEINFFVNLNQIMLKLDFLLIRMKSCWNWIFCQTKSNKAEIGFDMKFYLNYDIILKDTFALRLSFLIFDQP